ncbi:hypothetical protein BCR42DRAFT_436777 [Absidia repens]|uniref:Uncharacterized protein n=1 Tax=Absidia repens TaxID=90262 RepID=A0A1X2IKE6_9FUNG|nr:hypothetical protein BCR42DRAFT_436777 [Absidia repens]
MSLAQFPISTKIQQYRTPREATSSSAFIDPNLPQLPPSQQNYLYSISSQNSDHGYNISRPSHSSIRAKIPTSTIKLGRANWITTITLPSQLIIHGQLPSEYNHHQRDRSRQRPNENSGAIWNQSISFLQQSSTSTLPLLLIPTTTIHQQPLKKRESTNKASGTKSKSQNTCLDTIYHSGFGADLRSECMPVYPTQLLVAISIQLHLTWSRSVWPE